MDVKKLKVYVSLYKRVEQESYIQFFMQGRTGRCDSSYMYSFQIFDTYQYYCNSKFNYQ